MKSKGRSERCNLSSGRESLPVPLFQELVPRMKALFATPLRALVTMTLLCLCAALPSMAQNAALGSISGTVRDASGALVPKTTVTSNNTGTGTSRTLTTDSEGYYTAGFLQPGKYEVIAGGGGFGKVDRKNIDVTVGATTTVDAALPNASVSTEVVVTTDAPLLDTEKVEGSQVVDQ